LLAISPRNNQWYLLVFGVVVGFVVVVVSCFYRSPCSLFELQRCEPVDQVNNVGMSYPSALYFHELDKIDPTIIDNMIAINVNATTQMTRIVLPGMIERKRGAVINVASAAGRIPIGEWRVAVVLCRLVYR
jgi:hypothetical protein